MSEEARQFYDGLADDYDAVFANWAESVERQSGVISSFLRRRMMATTDDQAAEEEGNGRSTTTAVSVAPVAVWDCTCGVGTQAIGLASLGGGDYYRVTATDLSERSIDRARSNAAKFLRDHVEQESRPSTAAASVDCPIEFDVVDLLDVPAAAASLSAATRSKGNESDRNRDESDRNRDYPSPSPSLPDGPLDVVIAFDNPVAHFHTDGDLRAAFRNMASRLKPGGLLATSLRDYDSLVREKPRHSHVGVNDDVDSDCMKGEGRYGDGLSFLDNRRRSRRRRRVAFQIWDWSDDGLFYDSEMFVVDRRRGGEGTEASSPSLCDARSHIARFRAWRRSDVSRAISEVGLRDVVWHTPDESGYYQPIVSAKK